MRAVPRSYIRYLECMHRISDAVLRAKGGKAILADVIASIRKIFDADRTFLIHPLDPKAESWSVPVEDACSEYSGAFARNIRFAQDEKSRRLMRRILEAEEPLLMHPSPEDGDWVEPFHVQAQMITAVRPRFGSPWGLGLHRCRDAQLWSEEDRALFSEVAARVADLLGATHLQQELDHSRDSYRALFESMAQGVVYQDADGRILAANPAAERILGLSRAEMQGCTFTDACGRTIREDGSAFPDKQHPAMVALRTGNAVHGVVMGVFNPRENSYRWTSVSAIPQFRAGEAAPYQVFTTFDDITATKQAVAALAESEARFRRLVELSPDAILVHDRRGKLLFVNRAGVAMLGAVRADDLVGRSILSLVQENSLEAVKTTIKRQLEHEGGSIGMELKLKRLDGSGFVGEVTVSPLTFMGKPAVQLLVRDVSLRKQVEERLHTLAEALEQAGEGIFITDADARIEYANPAFTAITGYTAEEVLGKDCGILKSGEHDADFYAAVWQTLREGKVWTGTIIDRRKDGSRYPAQMSVAPIRDEQGRIAHYVAIQQDMSERERLEAQLRQAQKMEALGTLVGGIAHDFNNMLASILGYLYLAKKEVKDRPQTIKRLQGIERLSARAADMIQHMLTFARKNHVEMKDFSLTSFLNEAVKMARLSIPENIELQRDFCTEPLLVHGDAAQLQQALLHLLSNARDALADCPQPRIRISLRRHLADADFRRRHPEIRPGPMACLSVEDNGCGIPGEILDNVFEPFFTTKETGKGSGLGLAMVYGCVARHGGAIEMHSRPSEGTRLQIFLPLVEQETGQRETPAPDDARYGQGRTLLVADDEAFIREVTREALESLGYRVVEAEDGEQAWQLFRQQPDRIDAAILDLIMPHMGGVEAAQRMRKIRPDLPVLFATGYDQQQGSGDKPPLPNSQTMMKPFKIEVLSNLIGRMLEVRSWMS